MNEDWGILKSISDFKNKTLKDPFADVEIVTDKYKIYFSSKMEKDRICINRKKSSFLEELRIANMVGVGLNNLTTKVINVYGYNYDPSMYGSERETTTLIPNHLLLNSINGEGKSYLAEETVILFTEKHSSGYEHSRGFITIDVDTSRIKDLYEKGMVTKPLMNLMNVRVEKI